VSRYSGLSKGGDKIEKSKNNARLYEPPHCSGMFSGNRKTCVVPTNSAVREGTLGREKGGE